ncbi:HD-GYP domain-containing protein [Candidatus Saccharibacteria bacterium]|nr:HD-GYP domain-containing protein [Candidatus Saccharibacteria bacterium]
MFVLMPLAAAITQFFVHGVSLTSISVVSMLILLYCFSVLDTNRLVRDAHKKEIDALMEKQRNINLMVEQTTSALAEAIDAKDSYTNGHSWRVAEYSVMIARKAGKSEEECRNIHLTALLHDIGKIGIPDIIINKSGRLTDKEYNVIKSHPLVGREILSKISISPELAIGASFHHERYDGKGYPFGLKGEEIPEVARIVAVADTYDAMASKRSYRDVLSKQKIRSELEKGIGSQFDPKFARIMIELIDSGATLEVEEKYLKSTG